MIPEVKTLFERTNNGRKTLQDTPPPGSRVLADKVKVRPPKGNEWSDYAVLLTEHSDNDARLEYKTLRIQSPFLKETLQKTIKYHPGENFEANVLEFKLPVKSFFHYLSELKEVESSVSKHGFEQDILHLRCLISWIENEYLETSSNLKNLESGGVITHELLWTIFKPGDLVYTLMYEKSQILKIDSTKYENSFMGRGKVFIIQGWYIDTDGTELGRRDDTIRIAEFDDSQLIQSLKAVPLSQHPDREAITQDLIKRGQSFESMLGQHHRVYYGVALQDVKNREFDFGSGTRREIDYGYVHGRIIIDGASFGRFNPNYRIRIKKGDSAFESCTADEKHLLCSLSIPGFALREKEWFHFYVDQIEGIEYDTAAMNSLALRDTQKDLIRAMVENHVRGIIKFDDIIKGKGKGLVAVLHGPPGVGKTLTVESVAEHTKRPVYFASSGDLGTEPEEVDKNLGIILDCVGVWKAILLLDEADVFLEQRATNDLARNALVSIFLRRLEYFEGIMFLTTNRVTTFDHAFQSRIHLALRLDELSLESRLKIWTTFLTKPNGPDSSQFEHIKPYHYRRLAKRKLNGRQIKNAVRMAQVQASDKGRKVMVEDIQEIIDLQDDFHRDSKAGRSLPKLFAVLILVFHTVVALLIYKSVILG